MNKCYFQMIFIFWKCCAKIDMNNIDIDMNSVAEEQSRNKVCLSSTVLVLCFEMLFESSVACLKE